MLKFPTQTFFCEIYEIFKNTFFYRTPPVGVSIYLGLYQTYLMEIFIRFLNIPLMDMSRLFSQNILPMKKEVKMTSLILTD